MYAANKSCCLPVIQGLGNGHTRTTKAFISLDMALPAKHPRRPTIIRPTIFTPAAYKGKGLKKIEQQLLWHHSLCRICTAYTPTKRTTTNTVVQHNNKARTGKGIRLTRRYSRKRYSRKRDLLRRYGCWPARAIRAAARINRARPRNIAAGHLTTEVIRTAACIAGTIT
jgi:hypothetical protein